MNAPNDNIAAKGLREWWASPPRSGMQRLINPWEYRHLRVFGVTRFAGGSVAAAAGVVCLSYGVYGWASVLPRSWGAESRWWLLVHHYRSLHARQGSHARLWAECVSVALRGGCRTKPLQTGAVGGGHRNLLDPAARSHSQGLHAQFVGQPPTTNPLSTASAMSNSTAAVLAQEYEHPDGALPV
jgi:hypothetical protein